METGELELQNLIEGFRLTCQTEGKSLKTIEWYVAFLYRFLNFLKSSDCSIEIDQINKNDIRSFIRYLQVEARTPRGGQPLSGATVQGYVRTLKAFFSWAEREEYVATKLMAKIPVPKATNKLINTLSSEQIGKLIDVCSRINGTGYRNLTMLLLMLDCGIRVSELVNINVEDINLPEGQIKLRMAKGGHERIVPAGALVQKILWKYINHYRPEPLTYSVNNLFLNDKGLPLGRNGVQQMLRRSGRRAGISGVRCSPHTLRHTFAKNYLLNGGDIFSLQKILGHSSLSSVRTYLNLFATDIKKQHRRFSPVDNMAHTPGIYQVIRCSGSLSYRKRV